MYVLTMIVLWLTLLALSEAIPPILFYVNIDYFPACQLLLVSPIANFDKTYLS